MKLRLATVDVVVVRFRGTPTADVYICPNALWARDFADPQTMLDPTFNGDNILPPAMSTS
jgi:peptide/nickel transport system substrate-binding protein